MWKSQPFSVPACLLQNGLTEHNIFLDTKPAPSSIFQEIPLVACSAVSEVLLPDEMRHDVSACPKPPILCGDASNSRDFLCVMFRFFFGDVSLCVCGIVMSVCLRTTYYVDGSRPWGLVA